MWNLNPKEYWLEIRNNSTNTDFETITYLSNLGKLFHSFIAIDWEASNLEYEWLDRTIEKMKIYREWLSNAIRDIDIIH